MTPSPHASFPATHASFPAPPRPRGHVLTALLLICGSATATCANGESKAAEDLLRWALCLPEDTTVRRIRIPVDW